MFFRKKNIKNEEDIATLVWLHGWGRDKRSFTNILSFFSDYNNIAIDLPGFGEVLPPNEVWSTEDYARYVDQYIAKQNINKKIFIIGHSFGCRVGLRFANLYPDKIAGLVLISAAGLKKKRSIIFKIKSSLMRNFGKLLSLIDKIFKTKYKECYSKSFGSADYRNAQGIMKSIFIKTINEDLSEIAPNIKTKTLLIFGSNDIDTPPEFGKLYNKMMINSQFFELQNFDHNSILVEGRFQLQNLITKFIKD